MEHVEEIQAYTRPVTDVLAETKQRAAQFEAMREKATDRETSLSQIELIKHELFFSRRNSIAQQVNRANQLARIQAKSKIAGVA